MKLSQLGPVVFVGLAIACQGDKPVGPEGPPSFSKAVGQALRHLTYDDRMAALADELPGFGGIYFDENGQLVVQLTNAGNLAALGHT